MTKRTTRAALRSTTPPPFPTISVSEFMRGGLYGLVEPTTVMSHSKVVGTWYPEGQGMTASYYHSSTTPSPDSSTLTSSVMTGSASSGLRGVASTPGVDVNGLNSAIEKLHKYLARLPKQDEKEDEDGEEE